MNAPSSTTEYYQALDDELMVGWREQPLIGGESPRSCFSFLILAAFYLLLAILFFRFLILAFSGQFFAIFFAVVLFFLLKKATHGALRMQFGRRDFRFNAQGFYSESILFSQTTAEFVPFDTILQFERPAPTEEADTALVIFTLNGDESRFDVPNDPKPLALIDRFIADANLSLPADRSERFALLRSERESKNDVSFLDPTDASLTPTDASLTQKPKTNVIPSFTEKILADTFESLERYSQTQNEPSASLLDPKSAKSPVSQEPLPNLSKDASQKEPVATPFNASRRLAEYYPRILRFRENKAYGPDYDAPTPTGKNPTPEDWARFDDPPTLLKYRHFSFLATFLAALGAAFWNTNICLVLWVFLFGADRELYQNSPFSIFFLFFITPFVLVGAGMMLHFFLTLFAPWVQTGYQCAPNGELRRLFRIFGMTLSRRFKIADSDRIERKQTPFEQGMKLPKLPLWQLDFLAPNNSVRRTVSDLTPDEARWLQIELAAMLKAGQGSDKAGQGSEQKKSEFFSPSEALETIPKSVPSCGQTALDQTALGQTVYEERALGDAASDDSSSLPTETAAGDRFIPSQCFAVLPTPPIPPSTAWRKIAGFYPIYQRRGKLLSVESWEPRRGRLIYARRLFGVGGERKISLEGCVGASIVRGLPKKSWGILFHGPSDEVKLAKIDRLTEEEAIWLLTELVRGAEL